MTLWMRTARRRVSAVRSFLRESSPMSMGWCAYWDMVSRGGVTVGVFGWRSSGYTSAADRPTMDSWLTLDLASKEKAAGVSAGTSWSKALWMRRVGGGEWKGVLSAAGRSAACCVDGRDGQWGRGWWAGWSRRRVGRIQARAMGGVHWCIMAEREGGGVGEITNRRARESLWGRPNGRDTRP